MSYLTFSTNYDTLWVPNKERGKNMAHLVTIDDAQGNIIDAIVFCSDFCAKTHKAYAGWSGCHEIQFDEGCAFCGTKVHGIEGSGGE